MSDDYTTTEATILENMVMCSGYSRTKTEEWAHDEITRLRAENERLRTIGRWNTDRVCADLAGVTEERDRLREALAPFAEFAKRIPANNTNAGWIVDSLYLRDARAALEGVTEPASPWRDIESAPRDGSVFLAINNRVGPDPKPKGYNPYFLCFCFPPDEGVTYASDAGWREPGRDWPAYPTDWMPIPIPSANTQTGER